MTSYSWGKYDEVNYNSWYSFQDGSVGGWVDCVGDLLKFFFLSEGQIL